MYVKTLLVTVTTAGTPVALTSDVAISCNSFMVKQFYGNAAGSGYVGVSGLVKASGVNVIYDLTVATASFVSPGSQPGSNIHRLADYFLDCDVSGMKFLVTYWVY